MVLLISALLQQGLDLGEAQRVEDGGLEGEKGILQEWQDRIESRSSSNFVFLA